MANRSHSPPKLAAFEEVEANFGAKDLQGNFPEVDRIEPTKGELNVRINYENFSSSILKKHEESNFSEAYDTRGGRPRGLCLIINNKTFKKHDERHGTEIDCRNLRVLFTELHYEVKVLTDQTAEQMKSKCKDFILSKEHAKYNSCILAILSHGTNGKILGSDSKLVSEKVDIYQHFNDPACKLSGKPKIVIIQACRIDLQLKEKETQHPEASTEVSDGPVSENSAMFNLIEHFKQLNYSDSELVENSLTPDFADLLIAHSTLPGYVSYRHKEHGTWFIQAIVEVFYQHFHEEHVADMMVMVNRVVTTAFGQNVRCQMPSPINHLRKKLYFFPV